MAESFEPAPAGRVHRLLRLLTIVCAFGYPLALVGVIVALRYVGEQWWVTLVAMYLPRAGFALPLPFVVVAILLWGSRRLLLLQLVSILLVVVPLMGLNLGTGRPSGGPSGPAIRVVSYNTNNGGRGLEAMVSQIRAFAPDLVLLQDADPSPERGVRAAFKGWNVRHDGQFLVATRFPIRDAYVPPPLVYARGTGGSRFVRYTLETPLGLVDVFNMHTTSPREGLEEVRGRGVREEVSSGRLFEGKASGRIAFNAARRRRQAQGVAAAAVASPRAVIVAGDTNLPGLSWIYG